VALVLLARAGSLSSADLPFTARIALDELVGLGLAGKREDSYTLVVSD
jgi:hypothetical protein